MKALLALAGQGTRMYPLGVQTPKCLLPILNKPVLLWTLEALQQNGVNDFVLVINGSEFGQKIQTFVQNLDLSGAHFEFVIQAEQLGTAHVAQTAKDFFSTEEEFLFIHGDDLYGPKNIA